MHSSTPRAIILIALMLLMTLTPLAPLGIEQREMHLAADGGIHFAGVGESMDVEVTGWPDDMSYDLEVDIPDGDAFTHLELGLEPDIVIDSDSITWDSAAHWSHHDATYNGVNYNGTYMTTFGAENLWDFDGLSGSFPAGWTSSNAQFGKVNDNSQTDYLSCGTNGTTGGSLMLRHGTVNVESQVIDLSGLSNGYVYFWMKEGMSGCGEDPDTTEHLYFEYFNLNNVWSTVPSGSCTPSNTCPYFNAGLGTPGYSAQNVAYILPNDAFHAGFKFRFRMVAGSGTCCDWWFIDDLEVTVPGPGNWTSPSFGSHISSTYQVEPGGYGVASITAIKSSSTGLSWSVLDALTMQPIPGFEKMDSTLVDLGTIDWMEHPSLRLFIDSTRGPFRIESINIQGKIVDSFIADPSDNGWYGDFSWTGSGIQSSVDVTSPLIQSHRPIGGFDLAIEMANNADLQISIDGAAWNTIAADASMAFGQAAHTLQFRVISTGGTWTMDHFEVDIDYASLPEQLRLNIAGDERIDWGLNQEQMGPWGWQNRFADGRLTQTLDFTANNSFSTQFWLPVSTATHFEVDMWPLDSSVQGVQWDIRCGNSLIASASPLTVGNHRQEILFNTDELNSLNTALLSSPAIHSIPGVDFVLCRIDVDGTAGKLVLDGLLTRYDLSIALSFDSDSLFLGELNAYTATVQGAGATLNIPIPMQSSYRSRINATINDISSVGGMSSTLIELRNASATLTPSEPWLELVTTHSSSTQVLDKMSVEVTGLNERIVLEWPVLGGDATIIGNSSLIELHPTASASITQVSSSPQVVDATFRFRIQPVWEDEELVTISARVVTPEGYRSLPAVTSIGLGSDLGIENDFLIKDWDVINDLGLEVPKDLSYLKAGTIVLFSAELGFEGLSDGRAPRSGALRLTLYEDVFIVGQTTEVEGSWMNISYILPPAERVIEFSLLLEQMIPGGEDLTTINLSREFQLDSIEPMIIGANIAQYDHRIQSPSQTFRFEVWDRPILPRDLTLMLWRQWVNDIDYDDFPDPEEFSPVELSPPNNLSQVQGNYTYAFSDLLGNEGDLVTGYIIGSDSAGNLLQLGASSDLDEQLFTYQLKADGEPDIDDQSLGWTPESQFWLHPQVGYTLSFPLNEPNGLSDIDVISLMLDSESYDPGNPLSDPLELHWNGLSRQCETDSQYLSWTICDVFSAAGPLDPYTSELEFRVTFSLDWDLPDSGDLRTPEIVVNDRSGQGELLNLPELRWRFSPDVWIPYDTITLTTSGGSVEYDSAWVQPGSSLTLSGEVQFYRTGTRPTEEIEVEITMFGSALVVRVHDGIFEETINAPVGAGSYPLRWELFGLRLFGIDRTDTDSSVFWIQVDSSGPQALTLVAPTAGVELQIADLYNVAYEGTIRELYQVNTSTLSLSWQVVLEDGSDAIVVQGVESLLIPNGLDSGTLTVVANLNLHQHLPDSHFEKPSSLRVWITGSDMAGNAFDLAGNSEASPFARWDIHHRRAVPQIGPSDVTYSPSGSQNVNELITISVVVRNDGDADGVILFTISEVQPNGVVKQIASTEESIPKGAAPIQLRYDWVPDEQGLNHIRIEWQDSSIDGPFIEILPPKPTGLSAIFSETSPTAAGGIIALVVLIIVLITLLVRRRGTGAYYDTEWVEDWEDEAPARAPAQPPAQVAPAPVAPAASPAPAARTPTPPAQPLPSARHDANPYGAAAEAATTGGSDGWWQDEHGQWWQQSDDGGWWHQDPNGEWHEMPGYGN